MQYLVSKKCVLLYEKTDWKDDRVNKHVQWGSERHLLEFRYQWGSLI